MKQTTIDKWRYGLACWFFERNPSYLNETIDNLLDCTKTCLKRNLTNEAIQLLVYAYNLCLIYNLKQFSISIANECRDIIYQVKDSDDPRSMIEPVKILINLDGIIDHLYASYLFTILQREAQRFSYSNPDSGLQQTFLSVSTSLVKFLDLDANDKQELNQIHSLMIAQAWEESGAKRLNEGDAMRAMVDYEESGKEYLKTGHREKVKKISYKIRNATSKIC